jgi:hypothetical protein
MNQSQLNQTTNRSANRFALFLSLSVAIMAMSACGGSGTPPTPPPPTGNFSNSSLKGQYAFSMSGSDFNNEFFARIGSFIADGNGNITSGLEDVNTAAGEERLAFTASTYTIQADGRGVINLTNSSGTLSFSVTLLSPTQGLIVQTDLNATASGTFFIQNPNSFNAAGISGNYVFDVSGLDFSQTNTNLFNPGVPDSIVGQFISTGSGTVSSGLLDENDNAQLISTAAPFTSGNYQLDATDGTTFGRGNVTFIANGITYKFLFYIVDGSRVRMMETGANALTIGDAIAQSSVPTTNTTFNGNFAFLLSGAGTSGPITRIGRLTADGNGNLGSIAEDTNDAGIVAKVPSGSLSATTYAIDTANAGTGRGTLTFSDSKLGVFEFVFYLSSSSSGVIQDVSVNNVGDGSLVLQTGAPFTNSSLAGDYGFNFAGVSNNSSTIATAEEDYVGHITLSSSSSNNVTGAVDFSEFSSNQGVFTNIVISGNGLTIAGDGTNSSGTHNALSLKLNSSPSSTLNFIPYIVNSQTMFVAGVDSNRVISGTVTIQAP